MKRINFRISIFILFYSKPLFSSMKYFYVSYIDYYLLLYLDLKEEFQNLFCILRRFIVIYIQLKNLGDCLDGIVINNNNKKRNSKRHEFTPIFAEVYKFRPTKDFFKYKRYFIISGLFCGITGHLLFSKIVDEDHQIRDPGSYYPMEINFVRALIRKYGI